MKSMSSEILICLNRLGSGVAETQVRRVSVGLVKREWNVTIVSLLEDVIETPDLSNRKVQKINLNRVRC